MVEICARDLWGWFVGSGRILIMFGARDDWCDTLHKVDKSIWGEVPSSTKTIIDITWILKLGSHGSFRYGKRDRNAGTGMERWMPSSSISDCSFHLGGVRVKENGRFWGADLCQVSRWMMCFWRVKAKITKEAKDNRGTQESLCFNNPSNEIVGR